MKSNFLLIAVFLFCNTAIAVNPAVEGISRYNAKKILLPVGSTERTISLFGFSQLNVKEYEKLADVKLGFFNRLVFRKANKQLRKSILPDGTITNKKLNNFLAGPDDDKTKGFHVEGFALGFFLGFIGVAIAYLAFKDEAKKNRIKWAWLGMAIATVLAAIFIVALVAAIA